MLDNFKNLVDCEVFCRLKAAVLSAPRQGCPFFAERLELEQGVIDAIEEHLVVNMLAFCQECSEDIVLNLRLGLGCSGVKFFHI